LKDRVYSTTPANTDELKSAINREIRAIDRETCSNAISNFKKKTTSYFPKRTSSGTYFITILPAHIDYYTFILYIKWTFNIYTK